MKHPSESEGCEVDIGEARIGRYCVGLVRYDLVDCRWRGKVLGSDPVFGFDVCRVVGYRFGKVELVLVDAGVVQSSFGVVQCVGLESPRCDKGIPFLLGKLVPPSAVFGRDVPGQDLNGFLRLLRRGNRDWVGIHINPEVGVE